MPDRTEYFETVPAGELELTLWLESDRMGFSLDHVDAGRVDSQRSIIFHEQHQSAQNWPYGHVDGHVRAALFPAGHPYQRAAEAWAYDLDLARVEEVRTFISRWYAPNNAALSNRARGAGEHGALPEGPALELRVRGLQPGGVAGEDGHRCLVSRTEV